MLLLSARQTIQINGGSCQSCADSSVWEAANEFVNPKHGASTIILLVGRSMNRISFLTGRGQKCCKIYTIHLRIMHETVFGSWKWNQSIVHPVSIGQQILMRNMFRISSLTLSLTFDTWLYRLRKEGTRNALIDRHDTIYHGLIVYY